LPEGAMLAVSLLEKQIQPFLDDELAIAAINSPSQLVVSGNINAIAKLQNLLTEKGIEFRNLHTSHAFHSSMMSPIVSEFVEEVKKYTINPPQIPYISNVTGDWIDQTEATNPHYWGKHLRETVRFADGLEKLLQNSHSVLLEVAPGRTLSTLGKRHPHKQDKQIILTSIPHPQDRESDFKWILTTLGRLWLAGVEIDWVSFWKKENRYRLPLPTYPFERQRYWIDPADREESGVRSQESGVRSQESGDSLDEKNFITMNETGLFPHTPHPTTHTLFQVRSNELEKQIAKIWGEFLGIEKISRDDDFFDLGGDSLLAVQVISSLKEKLQVELSSSILLHASTVGTLAELIENIKIGSLATQVEDSSLTSSTLIELKKLNNQTIPLFLIHPVGGHIYIYRDLANSLDCSVYGLQAQGLDGTTEPLKSIEDMADYYLEAISNSYSEKTYLLGGSSFGGMVALEMAQKLHQRGQKVPLLVMIDTPGVGQMPKPLLDDAEIIAYLLDMAANISVSPDYLRQLSLEEQILYLSSQTKLINNLIPTLDVNIVRQYLAIFKINSTAMLNYIPQNYPGKIMFFRAQERDELTPHHPEYAWIDLALGGIEIYPVSGNHITMNYQPHVQLIASQLNFYLHNLFLPTNS
jgi:thioesterase domain-containing protein/malonyl CoA-acyl carrier protein transacylase